MSNMHIWIWLVLANTWYAAAHCAKTSGQSIFCNVIGTVWLVLAVIGTFVS